MERTIKIENNFWSDRRINSLSIPARLLYIGLWNFADDDGLLTYCPDSIAYLVFPSRPDLGIPRLIEEIEAIKLIDEITKDGKVYLRLKNPRGRKKLISQISTRTSKK